MNNKGEYESGRLRCEEYGGSGGWEGGHCHRCAGREGEPGMRVSGIWKGHLRTAGRWGRDRHRLRGAHWRPGNRPGYEELRIYRPEAAPSMPCGHPPPHRSLRPPAGKASCPSRVLHSAGYRHPPPCLSYVRMTCQLCCPWRRMVCLHVFTLYTNQL